MIALNEILDPVYFLRYQYDKLPFKVNLKSIDDPYFNPEFIFNRIKNFPEFFANERIRSSQAFNKKQKHEEEQFIIRSYSEIKQNILSSRSIIINHAEYLFPTDHWVVTLLNDLALMIGSTRFQIAFFYSPKKNQGFVSHIDNNEFFTLQLHGSKTWNLYEKNPLFIRGSKPKTKKKIYVLIPNDFFYIPRNTVHEVINNNDEISFSLSFIFKTDTNLDLCISKLEKEIRSLSLDESYYDSYNPTEQTPSVNELVSKLITKYK